MDGCNLKREACSLATGGTHRPGAGLDELQSQTRSLFPRYIFWCCRCPTHPIVAISNEKPVPSLLRAQAG